MLVELITHAVPPWPGRDLLPHISFWGAVYVTQESNHFQNLIAIVAGIGGIIFSLVIFVAESMKDNTYTARVLLKVSYLWPLAVAEVSLLFIYFGGGVNLLIVPMVVTVGVGVLWSLGRIITVLLNHHDFVNERKKLVVSRVLRSIETALDERIGDNIFMEALYDEKINFSYFPLEPDDAEDYEFFRERRQGLVSNIDIKKLEDFSGFLEKKARGHGYTMRGASVKKPGELSSIREDQPTTEAPQADNYIPIERPRVWIKYHDRIIPERNFVLCVRKVIFKNDDSEIRDAHKALEGVFCIKPEDSYSEQIRYEMTAIKDQIIEAVSNRRSGSVEELGDLYVAIIDSFLTYMSGKGVNTPENVPKEDDLLGGWEIIKRIKEDIIEVFNHALRVRDPYIVNSVEAISFRICYMAISHEDHYVFQAFSSFPTVLYGFAVSDADMPKKLRAHLKTRSWEFLKELADYKISSALRRDIGVEHLDSLKHFSVHLLKVSQDLIKRAIQEEDAESALTYMEGLYQILRHFSPSSSHENAQHLRLKLQINQSEADKARLLKRLKRQEKLEEIEGVFLKKRKEMTFGLAAWVLNKYASAGESFYLDIYRKFESKLPTDMDGLTTIFQDLHRFDSGKYWGWDWWDIVPDGKMQWVDATSNLERLYCVHALNLLSAGSTLRPNFIINSDLANMSGDDGSLPRILGELTQEPPPRWSDALKVGAREKIGNFRAMLNTAKQLHDTNRLEEKRSRPTSTTKKEIFKKEVLKSFHENTSIRKIFEWWKNSETDSNSFDRGRKPRFGINQVADKEMFIDDETGSYSDWGEHYGTGIAKSEDLFLFRKILEHSSWTDGRLLDRKVKELRAKNQQPVIIYLNNNYRDFVYNNPKITPKWRLDKPKLNADAYIGQYDQDVPVFYLHDDSGESLALVMGKAGLKLIQKNPLNRKDPSELRRGDFYMLISAFSEDEDLLREILNAGLPWLLEKRADDRRKFLKEQVLIKIFERLKVSFGSEFTGYKFKIDGDGD